MKGTNWGKLICLVASVVICRIGFISGIVLNQVNASNNPSSYSDTHYDSVTREEETKAVTYKAPNPVARKVTRAVGVGACVMLAVGVALFFLMRRNEARQAAALSEPEPIANDFDLVLTKPIVLTKPTDTPVPQPAPVRRPITRLAAGG